MKLKYYGTGGGAGIPEIFCDCRVCRHAREFGGKDIRTRSQAVIDDKISIDFPVDTYLHTAFYGLDMRKIHNVVITHDHYDHFLSQDVFSRPQGYGTLNVYATPASATKLCDTIERFEKAYAEGRKIRTSDFAAVHHPIEVEVPFEIDEYRFTPLKAHHAQGVQSVIYVIDNLKEDKHILWAHDTGPLYTSSWDWLKNYPHVFDFVSLDCTLGRGELITAAHMDIEGCYETKEKLRSMGLLDDHTKVYLSHIGHLPNRTHEELTAEAAELGMTPAFDGLTVEI